MCFVLLSRPPAVWSSTSLYAAASAAAHQRRIWPRFRGPPARATAVSSTSAPTARSPSTARPPAEWCSPGPTSPPPRRPRSYQAAPAARGTSGACDGALLRFYSDCLSGRLSLDWQRFHWLPPKLRQWGKFLHKLDWLRYCVTCWSLTLPNWIVWLKHLLKCYWDNQPDSVVWLKLWSSVSDKHIWCQKKKEVRI